MDDSEFDLKANLRVRAPDERPDVPNAYTLWKDNASTVRPETAYAPIVALRGFR